METYKQLTVMPEKSSNYAPARPWILGVFLALSAAACETDDHIVGAGTNGDLPNGAADGDNAAGGSDGPTGGGGNGGGGSDNQANGSNISTNGGDVAAPSVVSVGTTGDDNGTGGTGIGGNRSVSSASADINAAAAVSSISTSGGDQGTGGEVNGSSISTSGGDQGIGGEASGASANLNSLNGAALPFNAAGVNNVSTGGGSGAWGALPIPESCTAVRSENNELGCELEVACEGKDTPMIAACSASADILECDCRGILPSVGFQLSGVTTSDACAHALAACVNWPELEAGPFECTRDNVVNYPDSCSVYSSCTREGVIGDAYFTELQTRDSGCSLGESGWTCGCELPVRVRFGLATATSNPQCLDANGWCGFVGVEQIGSRTCQVLYVTDFGDACMAGVECERSVMLSGQAGTMYEDEPVRCAFVSDGLYRCSCTGGWYMEVAADDLEGACLTTVNLCTDE